LNQKIAIQVFQKKGKTILGKTIKNFLTADQTNCFAPNSFPLNRMLIEIRLSNMIKTFSNEELSYLNEDFEASGPSAVLEWINATFSLGEVVMATGFGAEGVVLIDMLARINKRFPIFYLDTELLFPETYRLRHELEERYGIRFIQQLSPLPPTEQARLYGDKLWERKPDQCCNLRKVEPLRAALKDRTGWITAIRREQSPSRAKAQILEWDAKFGLYKFNPLAAWKKDEVWDYIALHDVPYNPLYDRGYASIGCLHCTTPVAPGEDERAGRWRGFQKTECGLHKYVFEQKVDAPILQDS
jgi:phosphoadenosine phosphosulfate reductase